MRPEGGCTAQPIASGLRAHGSPIQKDHNAYAELESVSSARGSYGDCSAQDLK